MNQKERKNRQLQKTAKRAMLLFSTILLGGIAFAIGGVHAQAAVTSSSASQTAGKDSAYELPSYEIRELEEGTIVYDSADVVTLQVACESRNGIYLLSGKNLAFYSLKSGNTETVYTFEGNSGAYAEGDRLYVVYGYSVYVYDLQNMEYSWTLDLSSANAGKGSAVGVDTSGRIYVYVVGSSSSGIIKSILLYSPDGELLSSCVTGVTVYSFGGFNSSNGSFYVVGYDTLYGWGDGYPSKSMMCGSVKGNTITFDSTPIAFLCQSYYYNHQNAVDVLGNRYVLASSFTYQTLYIYDSDEGMDSAYEFARTQVDYTLENTYHDTTSIGVRAVYNDARDSLIIYNGDNLMTEYDPDTMEKLATFETQHYVFNILKMGDFLLIIEKEDGVYYLEIVDWGLPESVSISAGSTSLKVGESAQLSAVTGKSYAISCDWTSSDDTIASVTNSGRVVGWKRGTATIRVSILDGKYTASLKVTVTASDITSPSANAVAVSGKVSDNVSANNYTTYGSTVNSYLAENTDGTITRVEYIEGTGILVEKYSTAYKLLSSKTIRAELMYFGGFYSGEEYYYLVFGQDNEEESDECEVLRVVKYDKSWNRISQCSIYGAFTYVPFASGSARMTETAGQLYLYTCREMYYIFGAHHQSNMTFVIDEESMEVSQSYYSIMNIEDAGYVSHSFNQFVQTDGTYLYRVDHGDGGPRAVSITKAEVDGSITDVTYTLALEIQGSEGDNDTGVSVGGFEISTDNLLIAGNSVDQSSVSTYSAYAQRNIFLTVTDKNLEDTQVIWLTDYTSSDGITPRTPQLVKLDDDHFLVMWEEYDSSKQTVTVKMVTVDGDGTVTSDLISTNARLSDCQPIVTSDGLVRWYATNKSKVAMYVINPYDLCNIGDMDAITVKLASCSVSYINNTMDGFKVVWNKVPGATGYYIYRRNTDGTYSSTPTASVTGESTTEWIDPLVLTGGKDYTYKVAAYYKSELGVITVGPSGKTKTCKYLKGGEVESVTNTSTGMKVTWTKVSGANGYYIFRKAAGESDYTQVATVSGSSKVSWTDTSAHTSGKNYTYKVSAIFTNSKGQVTKGGAKVTKTTKYLAPGKISSLSNTANGVYIKWTKVTGASGYYVYRKVSGGSYTLVKTITSVGTVSCTDTAVAGNHNATYIYYIQPYFKSSAGVITKAGYTTKSILRLRAPEITSLKNSSSKTMTVQWETMAGVTGYQVQYSASSSFASGNKTLTITGVLNTSKVISGLTKGKTYYVRIRTYKTVNGVNYYSAWTTKKSVKISK